MPESVCAFFLFDTIARRYGDLGYVKSHYQVKEAFELEN